MKVNVNLFSRFGKWKYGGVVEVSGNNAFWSEAFKREVMANQNIVIPGTFEHHIVVITHRDDYEDDSSNYFCQSLWRVGEFCLRPDDE